ncbi:MAG TPA: phage major capsid protein [Nitrospira sp.]|nr:phage major capsid protein [Nitrospira sp.]
MNMLIESAKDMVLNLRIKAEERSRAGGADATRDALNLSLQADHIAAKAAELAAFRKYIMYGGEALDAEEGKALVADSGPLGGYAVPSILSEDFLAKPSTAAVGQLCTHKTLTKGDQYWLPTLRSRPSVSWYEEGEDFADDATLSLGGEFISPKTMGTRIPVTGKELDSIGGDFSQWLIDYAGPSFDEKLDKDLIIGDGIKNVEGTLVAPGVAEVVSGNALTLTADGIRKLFFALKAHYRVNATWVMNSATAEAVRGLKDTAGLPIYNEAQDTIFRRPIAINESLPDIAANSYPIVLADWSFYWIVTRMALSVFRNPYKRKPFILFDLTKRVGGQVVLAEAFVKQRVST